MKRLDLKILALGIMFSAGTFLTSCKGKQKDNVPAADTTTVTPAPTSAPAPVEIAADDTLTRGVKDATKDYPTVNPTVNNGEITQTGEVERKRLPGLMQS